MKNRLPRFILIVFCLAGSACQPRETVVRTTSPIEEGDFVAYSGLIAPSAKDYLKMEESKMIRSFADVAETEFSRLPPSVDLSTGLPQAADQGKQNSCTGWAVAFAVRSFQENRELGWGLDREHLFSPSFVYNQLNDGKDEGVDLADVMNFVMNHGTVPMKLLPYNDRDYTTQPSDQLKKLAKGFRTLGYRRINEKNVDHIKAYLAAGEPVVMVVEMFSNFLPKGMRRSGNMYKEKDGGSLGHHALVAVGYDNAKGALKILNSWGTRWGEKGYGWIDYAFAPKVIKQAFVLYDLPTPSGTLTQYASLTGLPQSSLPAPSGGEERAREEDLAKKVAAAPFKVGLPAVEEEEPLLIVPDEAGITIGDHWLRLASPVDQAKDFFSEPTSEKFKDYDPAAGDFRLLEDLLNKGVIGKIHFYKTSLLPVATHQGVTFESGRADVHRIYGKPDHVDEESHEDTYFFHAISEKWGGINVTKHASLVFHYDPEDVVNFMALESVFKKVKMGKGFEAMKEGESQKQAGGTLIKSDDGQIEFVVPPQFTDIKKSVWEGTGYGYFITNPNAYGEYLNVKVFFVGEKVTEGLLKQRIEADSKNYGIASVSPSTQNFAGIDWKIVTADGVVRYYGGRGKTIYQLQIASGGDLNQSPWIQEFLGSLKIR